MCAWCAGSTQHVAVALTMQADSSATLSHHTLLGASTQTAACTLGGIATKPASLLAMQQPLDMPVAAAVTHGAQPATTSPAAGQSLSDITRQLEAIVAGKRLHMFIYIHAECLLGSTNAQSSSGEHPAPVTV